MNQKAIVISNQTKQKVEAAKIFIQRRYSKLISQEQQKKQYWDQLNSKMKNLNMSMGQCEQIKRNILHKEAQKLRTQRKKLTILEFEPVKIIGKGAFGEVRLCRWKKNGQPVAVKKLKKSQMIFKNKIIQVRQERNVLANSQNSQWIVGLKCSFQDNDHLYLVMDYVAGGDLMNLLIKKDIFTHQQARFYIAQMILAIHTVHQLKYIHRDIKPDNILIDEKGHIRLSDFGLCKHTEMRPKKLLENIRKNNVTSKEKIAQTFKKIEGKQLTHKRRKLAFTAVGTPDYVAPQVQGKNGYTETVDWWSLGVIFYEMLVGYPPFASQQSSITWQKIQNWRKFLVIPKDVYVSAQAADLIRKLINDPQQRLGTNGVQQIMAHPFFKGIDWKNIRNQKAPNVPTLKNTFDTCNFDPFDEDQPWVIIQNKYTKKNKKGTQFIGYTYKPQQQNNSDLIKALIDLDHYRKPQELHRNNLQSLHLEQPREKQINNFFKKEKVTTNPIVKKQIFATTSTNSPKYSITNKNIETSYKKLNSPTNKDRIERIEKPLLQSHPRQPIKEKYVERQQKKIVATNVNICSKQEKKAPITTINNAAKVKVFQRKPLQFRK